MYFKRLLFKNVLIKRIAKADIFSAIAIAIALPGYYKVKYLLDGQMSVEELFQISVIIEVVFAFLLALILLAIYRFGHIWLGRASSQLIRRLSPLLLVGTAIVIAVVFTRFFFSVVVDWGSQASFEFDIIVLAVLLPLLVSGVSDRIFLTHKMREAEQMALSARFEILKTRLSPHFLFNSLNTLVDIIEEDQVLAVQFVEEMSAVYRYIIENRDVNAIELGKEIEAIRSLIYLLASRHPGAIKLELQVDEFSENRKIVPLAVQTLVENALKHNLYSSSQPLLLRIYTENSQLVIENTLNKRNVDKSTEMGLENLARRIEHVSKQHMSVVETADFFTVRIPLLN